MNAEMIVALIAVTASLFLAVRALQAEGLNFETKAWMAAIWAIIIAVVAFVATQLGA